jgi:hypothetical protein
LDVIKLAFIETIVLYRKVHLFWSFRNCYRDLFFLNYDFLQKNYDFLLYRLLNHGFMIGFEKLRNLDLHYKK